MVGRAEVFGPGQHVDELPGIVDEDGEVLRADPKV
jgi:hypothetical protein